MPVAFEPNQGQADPAVRFLARGRGYGLFLTPTEAVLVLAPGPPVARGARGIAPAVAPAVVRMRMMGADPAATIAGVEPRSGHNHYLVGTSGGRLVGCARDRDARHPRSGRRGGPGVPAIRRTRACDEPTRWWWRASRVSQGRPCGTRPNPASRDCHSCGYAAYTSDTSPSRLPSSSRFGESVS